MSQFYARYVPPSSNASAASQKHLKEKPLEKVEVKDFRSLHDAQELPTLKETKRRRESDTEKPAKKVKRSKSNETNRSHELPVRAAEEGPREQLAEEGVEEDASIIEKYSVSKFAKTNKAAIEVRNRKDERRGTLANDPESDSKSARKESKKRKVKDETPSHTDEDGAVDSGADDAQQENSKHSGVLSKFARSREQAIGAHANGDTESKLPAVLRPGTDDKEIELHGLQPIPQPEEIQEILHRPTYSTLPPWLAAPLIVPRGSTSSFESLGISKELLSNLRENGLENSFPIQATVVPLLCEGTRRHQGDLCISAATGSGKTLGYVLPMVESLKSYVTTKLRGLIIVPTRELVKQVRATCEMCAAGTNLKIATALGSKSITEEQDSLVSSEDVYDPRGYAEDQKRPVNWSDFSLDGVFDQVREEDALDRLDRRRVYSSKIDILISTPGRLVDHLRSTTGFNLDDVKWVVIDEADRLLNESYQEWVEVVIPALESRKSTKVRDTLLEHMRLAVPPRQITKVALSATMTQDISKLNSLGLRNPKMIVLGHSRTLAISEEEKDADASAVSTSEMNGLFKLPPTLAESTISVGDGSEKPLHLLDTLRNRIMTPNDKLELRREPPYVGEGDTSSSSSLDSDSTSDSDSESADSSESSTIESDAPLPAKARTRPGSRPEQSQRALIFTRSAESATRLSRLLALLDANLSTSIATLTRSTTSSASSRRAIQSFRQGKISILIATDRASRGLDVPDLEHVISYDVPASVSTYVHRVGRTARAGKAGSAWTLLAHREARWFWKEIGKGNAIQRNGKVNRVAVELDEALKETYEEALKKLGEEVKGL